MGLEVIGSNPIIYLLILKILTKYKYSLNKSLNKIFTVFNLNLQKYFYNHKLIKNNEPLNINSYCFLKNHKSINIFRKKYFLNKLIKNKLIKNKLIKEMLLNFNCLNQKIYFNYRNFFKKTNQFITIGIVLKSLNILKKREKKITKNQKFLIFFIIKKIVLNYNSYYMYLYFEGWDNNLFLFLKKGKFFKKLPINTIIIKPQYPFYLLKRKKIRRIKKRIKKRIIKNELKVFEHSIELAKKYKQQTNYKKNDKK